MNEHFKILVVDDETIGRQLLEAVLTPEGYDILFAENGREAVEVAMAENPDLIMLDVMMPEIDGFEACKLIRQTEQLIATPVFLITALDDRDSRLRGLDAGADDYISKPFDRIEILAKVKNVKMNRKMVGVKSTPSDKVVAPAISDPLIDKLKIWLFATDNINLVSFEQAIILSPDEEGENDALDGRFLSINFMGQNTLAFFGAGTDKPTSGHQLGMSMSLLKQANLDNNSLSEFASKAVQNCSSLWETKPPFLNWISLVQANGSGDVKIAGVASVVFVCQKGGSSFQPYYLTGNQDITLNQVSQLVLLSPSLTNAIGVPGIMQLLAENPVVASREELQQLLVKGLPSNLKTNQTHVAAFLRF